MVDRQLGDGLANFFEWLGKLEVLGGNRWQTAVSKGKLLVRRAAIQFASKMTSTSFGLS